MHLCCAACVWQVGFCIVALTANEAAADGREHDALNY